MVTLSRRAVLTAATALLCAGLTLQSVRAAETIRVGVLKFGTVNWEIDTIRTHGLDTKAGVTISALELASNDATKVALQSGEVNVIVSDFLWAARMRAEGRPMVFVPFSATEGAMMVAPTSAVRSVGDLRGKTIGVSGGPLDKSWLLLQGWAKATHGIDLAKDAQPVFGAPPLLSEKALAGELDAVLTYWNFAARLEAKGFRTIAAPDEAARSFGVQGAVAMIGYVFEDGWASAHPEAVRGFVHASRAAKAMLATSDAEWTRLRPLTRAEDDATFESLKRRFRDGIPTRALALEEADATRLYDVLARFGGEKLVGPARTVPAGLYWSGLRDGS
jgi:NitT/TauT family transport system substrate-binding protein